MARAFHALFPNSELILISEGRHFIQIDEPEQVAHHILNLPLAKTSLVVDTPVFKRSQASGRLRHQLMYILFGMINIVLALPILFDRWRLYRRVQRIFQTDNLILGKSSQSR